MTNIRLTDSFIDVVTRMSDGNPGAMSVVTELIASEKVNVVDPDWAMGGLGVVLQLDTLNIYGTDIYVLMNDICERNMVKFITVLRAHQLGFLDSNLLRDACSRQDYSGREMIDIEDLHKKVKNVLPDFVDLDYSFQTASK